VRRSPLVGLELGLGTRHRTGVQRLAKTRIDVSGDWKTLEKKSFSCK
jgi:hypothetical protein